MTVSRTMLKITAGLAISPIEVEDVSRGARGTLRPKALPRDPIVVEFDGRTYRIDHERTRDGLIASDIRFSLIDDGGRTLAVADKVDGRRGYIVDLGGATYRLEKGSSLFALRYALLDGEGTQVGLLAQTTGFTLWKRRFRVDLPASVDAPTGVFLFFLVANVHFR
jgi:hypothetical protein